MKTDSSRQDKEKIKTICNDFTAPVRLFYTTISLFILLLCNTQQCSEVYVADTNSVSVLRCDAEKDGKCEGEVEVYNHFHFNCLAAHEPGRPRTHNFCKYHYDNATTCPVHPFSNKTYF